MVYIGMPTLKWAVRVKVHHTESRMHRQRATEVLQAERNQIQGNQIQRNQMLQVVTIS